MQPNVLYHLDYFMKHPILYKGVVKVADRCITLAARSLPAWKKTTAVAVLPPMFHIPVSLPVNHAQLPQPFAGNFIDIKHIPGRRIFTLKKVWVSGGAVVIKNLRIFLPSLTWLQDLDLHRKGKLLIKQWLPGVKKTPAHETVALVYDHWSCHNYYHWMIEALPRLLLVQKQYPDSLLLVPEPCPEYIRRTLDLMGATKRYPLTKDTGKLIAVQKLVLPQLVYYYQAHELDTLHKLEEEAKAYTRNLPQHASSNTPVLRQELIVTVRQKLLTAFKPKPVTPFRKVYISRARQKTRRLVNEEDIQPLLDKWGFELVFFEEMELDAQITLMQETALLVGVHGANMVNTMFLNPGTPVIELMNREHFNEAYYILASSFGLPYYSIPCAMADPTIIVADDKIALNNAHLLITVSALEETIAACMKDLPGALRIS